MAITFVPRLDWSRVLALAWQNSTVLNDLRQDPKETITQIAKGKNGRYGEIVDQDTAIKANTIKTQAENDPQDDYTGFLPVPKPRGLEELEPQNIEELLRYGITGILKFNEEDAVQLWAQTLSEVWKSWQQDNSEDKSNNLLIKVRKDPLNNLPHVNELQNTKYGIFPIPDPPEIFNDLQIDLGKLLPGLFSDAKSMSHLGGIFLFGS